jgi:hypothetical protein
MKAQSRQACRVVQAGKQSGRQSVSASRLGRSDQAGEVRQSDIHESAEQAGRQFRAGWQSQADQAGQGRHDGQVRSGTQSGRQAGKFRLGGRRGRQERERVGK